MRTTAILAAGAAVLAAAAAQAGTIKVTREIRYPTSYESQQASDFDFFQQGILQPGQAAALVPMQRPPVPSDFQTREVGAIMTADQVGAARAVTIANKPVYLVKFFTGSKAQFIDGVHTVVDGVRYRGLGLRDGRYYILNTATGEILSFKTDGPSVSSL